MVATVNLSGVRLGETYKLTENGQVYTIETKPPSTADAFDSQIEGIQKTPSIFRGIFDGALSGNNKPGFHFCEPFSSPLPRNTVMILGRTGQRVPNLSLGSPVLQLEAFIKSADVQVIVRKVQEFIRKILDAVALSGPLADSFYQLARDIAEGLRFINKLIRLITEGALLIAAVERYIAALITLISRLPEIFATALAECLQAIRNAIVNALAIDKTFDTNGLLGEIQALQANISLAEQAIAQVEAGAEAIGQSFDNFVATGNASLDRALNTIKDKLNKPLKPIVNVTIF